MNKDEFLEQLLNTPEEKQTSTQSNELEIIASMLNSMSSSLDSIKAEKENIDSLVQDLKNNHNIAPKISKKVAMLLHDPEKLENLHETRNVLDQIEQLLGKVKKLS